MAIPHLVASEKSFLFHFLLIFLLSYDEESKKSIGSIVNVSSIAGTRSFPNLLPYSMSKAALDQFTKCLALGN
jgi:NAD(P)-dependent dehydrogenase (short-subunit alcohol dehydrogenase family)